MEKLGVRHLGLFLFGIILLVIGLVLCLYYTTSQYYGYIEGYPYRTEGIILVVAGILLAVLGFIYSPKRTEQTKPNPTPTPTTPTQ